MKDRTEQINLVEFSREYLDWSWVWLSDPETKALTMTPDFTRADQLRFYQSLKDRSDYWIWGVELDRYGPIGAAGLKNPREITVEYWGYIGDRELRGQGLGWKMLQAVEAHARELGFEKVDLKVSSSNMSAMSLYLKAGYRVLTELSTSNLLVMAKEFG